MKWFQNISVINHNCTYEYHINKYQLILINFYRLEIKLRYLIYQRNTIVSIQWSRKTI